MSDELRAALETSFAAAEKEEAPVSTSTPEPVAVEPAAPEQQSEPVAAPESNASDPVASPSQGSEATPKSITELVTDAVAEPVVDTKPVDTPAPLPKIDNPPASWTGEAKKVWAELPLNVRSEVIRRERDTMKVLQETALDRKKVAEITQVITPHMDRIGANYQGNPLIAINNLLETERVLTSGTPLNKAQLVANIIQNFGVDINALDGILSGQGVPQEMRQQSNQQTELEKLLDQRLQPVMSFVQQQQAAQQKIAQQTEQQVLQTVESMSIDSVTYPYFDTVRDDMADIIEMNAKRGIDVSLEEAYNRAVRMNGHTAQAVDNRQSTQAATNAALQAHQEAQKAKGAAVSVSGSPSHTSGPTTDPADLRSLISSQFENRGERI
jgi:hypothetical protein